VLADHAPDLATALERAVAAGCTHLNLDGTDLGYENAADGFRHPVKKPKGGELAESNKTFNAVICGVQAVAERANAPLKVILQSPAPGQPRPPSHHPNRPGAALVLLQLEHGRTT